MVRVSLRYDLKLPGLIKFDPPPPPLRQRPEPAAPRATTAARERAPAWNGVAGTDFANLERGRRTGWIGRGGPTALPLSTEAGELFSPDGRIPEDTILEYLFDELTSHDIQVDAFDLSASGATITVASLPAESERISAANAVFTAIPMALDAVTFAAPGDRTTHRREEVERTESVRLLFDLLEERGMTVNGVDLIDGDAVFYVTLSASRPALSALGARRIAADHLPATVENISFVGLPDARDIRGLDRLAPAPSLTRQPPSTLASATGAVQQTEVLTEDERRAIAAKLFEELRSENFLVDGLHLTTTRATVFVRPLQFRELARNIGRAARVVANNAPASVEEIVVVTLSGGMELNRVMILRRDLENAVAGNGSPEEIWVRASIEGPVGTFLPRGTIVPRGRYPKFTWTFAPNLRQHIGSGEDFYLGHL